MHFLFYADTGGDKGHPYEDVSSYFLCPLYRIDKNIPIENRKKGHRSYENQEYIGHDKA